MGGGWLPHNVHSRQLFTIWAQIKRLNQAIGPHFFFYLSAVTVLDQVHIEMVNVTLMRLAHH